MASASLATAGSPPPPDGNDTTSPPPTTPPKETLPSPPPPPVVTPIVTPIGAIRSSPPSPAFISLVESPEPPAVAPIPPRISPPPPATLKSPVKSPPPPPDPLFEFAPPPPIMPIDFPPPGPPLSPEPAKPPLPPAKPFVPPPPPPLPSSELIPPLTPPPLALRNGSSSETIIPSTASSSHTPLAILVGLSVGIGVSAILLLTILFICHRKMKNRGPIDYYYKTPPKDNWYDHHLKQRFPSPGTRLMAMLANPSPPPFPPPQLGSNGDSCSNNSVSENHFSPPSHSIPLGLSGGMFTFEELAAATHGFSEANLLGEGGFGYVYKGILPNRREIAVKQLKMGSKQGEREFQAEVDTISRVHHRHLVTLVGYCSTGAERLLVYEFVKNKTLEFHLHEKGQPVMEWATRLKIAIGSAKGLAYLHEDCNPTIIHRDIKGANILLDSKFEAKVSDFGLAKFFSDADHLITHVSTRVVGTFGYLAPEYASTGKASDKSDVFSYGVVLLELITGRQPIENTAESFTNENLVYWARPLLTKALEDGNYDALVDPRLQRDYNTKEMAHMVACAAACVRHSAWLRPRLSQIVRALEGDISLMDLDEGIRPGHSRVCESFPNYGMEQFLIDMNKFDMKLGTQENGLDWYSENTRNNGLHPPLGFKHG